MQAKIQRPKPINETRKGEISTGDMHETKVYHICPLAYEFSTQKTRDMALRLLYRKLIAFKGSILFLALVLNILSECSDKCKQKYKDKTH